MPTITHHAAPTAGTWQAPDTAPESWQAPASSTAPDGVTLALPADLFAASWAAVVAATAPARDKRPILAAVHVEADTAGAVTLTATDAFALHRVTLPAGVADVVGAGSFMLPAWKAADVARLCKGAAAVNLAATGTTPATCVATLSASTAGADGAAQATMTAAPGLDAENYPATAALFDLAGWPDHDGAACGFRPDLFARAMTAADKFTRGQDRPLAVVDTMLPLKPARFSSTREDGATFVAVLMPHKLPTV